MFENPKWKKIAPSMMLVTCGIGIIFLDGAASAVMMVVAAVLMAVQMKYRRAAWAYSVAMVVFAVEAVTGILPLIFVGFVLTAYAIYTDLRSTDDDDDGGQAELTKEEKEYRRREAPGTPVPVPAEGNTRR